ncbi:DUF5329 domain-containing protein [Stenotrophomonas sp. MMGLT7]|uniref:DUF5329 domain-containing protein n=1 Tax=Stenotrophomonas sp. MMGLT7 TaxID=2901227 RepID=UPI001E38C0F5|nr:DUF5329 domain-containing protein [Stenotrophomonas sp. MMGLT7]MCD7099504.1 DUF5329 domain-containing protein [Stenotrophomonas sp. MMGLT7]
MAPLQGLAADGRANTQAQVEIHALLDGLATSSCRFQRNGTWYDGERARAHLQRKYAYLQRRGLAVDAEAFIEQAASRSSVSGRVYRVACPGQPERDASPWFRERLQQLRGARGAAP